jgi:hypothetical protein
MSSFGTTTVTSRTKTCRLARWEGSRLSPSLSWGRKMEIDIVPGTGVDTIQMPPLPGACDRALVDGPLGKDARHKVNPNCGVN